MIVKDLIKLLKTLNQDAVIDMSSDEEGNQFLPVYDNPRLCLAIEPEEKRIILFPSHQ